jgi:hypothetical protein
VAGSVLDDIGVGFELFQNGDLPHGGGGYALILILKLDLLDGNKFLGDAILGSVDNTICSLPNGFKALEVIHPT